MLAKMWTKGNLSVLLVGMHTRAVSVENCMVFPPKAKEATAF